MDDFELGLGFKKKRLKATYINKLRFLAFSQTFCFNCNFLAKKIHTTN